MITPKRKTDGSRVVLSHDILRHFDILLNTLDDKDIDTVKIEYVQAVKYIGDFAGLLRSLDVYDEYIPFIITLNGLKASSRYNGDFLNIKLINGSKLESMFKVAMPRK